MKNLVKPLDHYLESFMKKYFGLGASILALASYAFAGNSTGGGDNTSFVDEAAWFSGDSKTILICSEMSPTFGVSHPDAQADIERAFGVWRNYLEEKRVFQQYPEAIRLSTKIRFVEQCDGTEDLKFYLGTTNAAVEEAKKKYHNPTAFAERTFFDKKTNWGKGFIWIASSKSLDLGQGSGFYPNWEQANNLLAIFLHEIGHVYGCEHVSGTIMTSEIINVLNSSDHARSMKAKIDHARELYRCHNCSYDLTSTISIADKPSGWKIFKSLFGKAPDDFAKLRITRAEHSAVIKIELIDGSGVASVSFIQSSEIFVKNDVKVFRSPIGLSKENYSLVSNGTTLAPDGKRVAISLEYNMGESSGSSPLVLAALDEGRRIELARFKSVEFDTIP